MSARPEGRPKTTLAALAAKKRAGEPIVMVTAYDHPSAQIAEDAGVDMILVGDSAAMTVLGHPDTLSMTVDEMTMLAGAVSRGAAVPFIVVDLPFGSYEASDEQAVRTAQHFVKNARCDAVKLERGGTTVERARAIVQAGIPVMGHIGLTPQTATSLSGYRAQGTTAEAALALYRDALALEAAGCFAIVLEAVPSRVAELVVAPLRVPVIGIGAGPAADGQVLVLHDLVGLYRGPRARFVKRYADARTLLTEAIAGYAADVASRAYPAPEHGYGVPPEEVAAFAELIAREPQPPRR
ncbi:MULTISPECIES: 3-methyl-2-oxobutanoate hydroxymethyltransferase [Bacteria]|uniref:3-methyl-2-oxobutanoate hydroxymethyltransferase n=1 Tax=Bacteria TaxID=2 RepID=UPI003C797180